MTVQEKVALELQEDLGLDPEQCQLLDRRLDRVLPMVVGQGLGQVVLVQQELVGHGDILKTTRHSRSKLAVST